MTAVMEIRHRATLPASPEAVWEAVATGPGTRRWLFPVEIDGRVGGTFSRGPSTITAWEPPSRFSCRYEGEEGFVATLNHHISAGHDRSTAVLDAQVRWESPGPTDETWTRREDAARCHTALYYHNLAEYLNHFSGLDATYVAVDQTGATGFEDSASLRRALGISVSTEVGDPVELVAAGRTVPTVVDVLTPHFVGLRGPAGLYRFLGRSEWGWPIGVAHHLYGPEASVASLEADWAQWLRDVVGDSQGPVDASAAPGGEVE